MHFHDTKASKLVATITAVSLIAHAKVLAMTTSLLGNGGDIMALLLGLGGLFYPVFGVLSVIGMWRHRPWGFYAFYAHLVLGTLLFGVSFIPFLPAALPHEMRIWGVIVINLFALFSVAAVHRQIAKKQALRALGR